MKMLIMAAVGAFSGLAWCNPAGGRVRLGGALGSRFDLTVTNNIVCVFGRAEIPDNHESVKFVIRPMNAWGRADEAMESVPDAYWAKGPLYPF